MSTFIQLLLHCGRCYVEVQFFWRHEHTRPLWDAKKRGPFFRVGSGDDSGVGIVVGQVGALPGLPPRHMRQDASRLWGWVHQRVYPYPPRVQSVFCIWGKTMI